MHVFTWHEGGGDHLNGRLELREAVWRHESVRMAFGLLPPIGPVSNDSAAGGGISKSGAK